MFASLGLPFPFKSRCAKKPSLTNKDQSEARHDGPAESEQHSDGTFVADTFVVDTEPDEKCEMILVAMPVTDPGAGSTKYEVRRFGSTANHGGCVGLHGEQRVYVVSEYWTAEDHSAIKGDNHQLHAIFASVTEANAYAEKFVRDVLEPYVRSDAWHADD